MYPSLEHQLPLLDELTAAGMSSDEEQIVGQHKQYAVIEPAWRSDIVTSWLRIFDALHAHAKRSGLFGGQRGAQPRMRVTSVPPRRSTSERFVSKLPRNAYDDWWFNSQISAEDTVQPGPPIRYFHDRKTIE